MSASQLQPQQLDRAFAVMREGVARGEAGSAVMAIASSHEMIRCEAASPPDGGEQATLGSIFLLASITKPFFGTAIMQLAEQGRLLISDPVVRYVPEFGRFGKEGVTIWHLLTHTSGLAEEVWEPLWEAKAPASEHLEAACSGFLHFPPGTQYEYCNLSFSVLAEIVTRVSGQPYVAYLHDHILEPLGMADTAFDFEGEQAARMMPVHSVEPMPGGDDLHYFRSLSLPAGGLYSTAADLVAFGQAMLNGLAGRERTIVSRAGIATMTRLHTQGLYDRASKQRAYYGLGWGKPRGNGQVLGTPAAFGHSGATATLLWIEPDYDLVFVFLTNLWGQENRVAYAALNAVLGAMCVPA